MVTLRLDDVRDNNTDIAEMSATVRGEGDDFNAARYMHCAKWYLNWWIHTFIWRGSFFVLGSTISYESLPKEDCNLIWLPKLLIISYVNITHQ